LKHTGCCKSPVQSEKQVYLSKPALKPAENLVFERKTRQNELKTWFSLDLVYEGLDKNCKPGLSTKTCQKPALNQV
jgi:hypothetical protein